MGRPSKLSEVQWEKLHTRLIHGESILALSKEFGISKPQIYKKFPTPVSKLKNIAQQIVTVDERFNNLSASEQRVVANLADELKTISANLAGAARNGSLTAFRLSGIARSQAEKINHGDPMKSAQELQAVAALTKVSNEAASMGLALLNANKEAKTEDKIIVKRDYGVIEDKDA